MLGTLSARILARVARARREGVRRTITDLVRRMALLAGGIVLSPVALVVHLAGFRRLTFITSRIGHLAAEPDCFLKACAMGELPQRRWFFLAPAGHVANEHLLSYWTPRIRAVRDPIACRLLAATSALGLARYEAGRYVLWLDHSQEIYRLNARWGDRPPLLALTAEDEAWANEMLVTLGVPKGRWIACVHAREPGFSPADEDTHAHRNASPEALLPAVAEIVSRGGWCVRMGDPTTRTLPQVAGLIDYAHHPMRSARLDVALCARARFFLGNSSGLALVSSVFGRPSLLVNMVPMSALGVLPTDISICKLYRSRREARMLRFDEVLGSPTANFRYRAQYENAGIELIENSADEIRDGVIELLDRLEGHPLSSEDRKLQEQFARLLRPGDYGFGAASRVAASFLRRHRALLN